MKTFSGNYSNWSPKQIDAWVSKVTGISANKGKSQQQKYKQAKTNGSKFIGNKNKKKEHYTNDKGKVHNGI